MNVFFLTLQPTTMNVPSGYMQKHAVCVHLLLYSQADLVQAEASSGIFVCFILSTSACLWSTSILQSHSKTPSSFPLQNNCVGVFVRELKSILSNVTVYNDDRDSLLGIQSALLQLEAQHPAARGQQVSQRGNGRLRAQTAPLLHHQRLGHGVT